MKVFLVPLCSGSFACPELAVIHKTNTVFTTGALLLLLTSQLQGLHYRCSCSSTELGTDQEAAIIRSVEVLCGLGPWHLPPCTMHTRPRVLPQNYLDTTQTHIDIGSASIPSLPFRNIRMATLLEHDFTLTVRRFTYLSCQKQTSLNVAIGTVYHERPSRDVADGRSDNCP